MSLTDINSQEKSSSYIKLTPKVGDEVMSLADILREEGRFKAAIEIAKKMLAEGAEPAFVAKVTQLPIGRVLDCFYMLNHGPT